LGLPVFAQIPDSSIGIARLFGPTGGYLLAFPAGAFITGYLAKKFMSILPSGKSFIGILISMLAGEVLIICTGAAYLGAVYLKNMQEAFISGAAVFLIWTIAKAIIGASIYFGISNTKLQKHK
jgi:biotin transport system substrate-specific component